MKLLLIQIKESLIFASKSLVINKLRTFLSLLGITIGIFVIISIFAVIDSLENFITQNLGSLGDDIIYVQKWPWVTDGRNFQWWKYINRPVPQFKEYKELKKNLKKASFVSFVAAGRKSLKTKTQSLEDITVVATTYEFNLINRYNLIAGRFFTKKEDISGSNMAVVGYDINQELFKGKTAIGEKIKIGGIKYKIIGVFEKQGLNMGIDIDHYVIVPVSSAYKFINIKSESSNPYILVKSKPNTDLFALKEEIRRKLRKIRRLPPNAKDNFALNQASIISNGIQNVFKTLNMAGLFIGIFSILIGGFGIANIMFVSVKERTKIIGIQKALGAKNYFILLQFLFESSILSALGGIIGLLLIFVGFAIANHFIDFIRFGLSFTNIFEGMLISIVIGLLAGFIPAKTASELQPVEAMNSVF